jgi:site-specific recombinase XerD
MTESIMDVNEQKLSKKSSEIIDLFLDSLWMERGLSKNTLSANRSDLNKFLIRHDSQKFI